MLEPSPLRGLLPLLAALALAPLATASLTPQETAAELGDQVGSVHPWAEWAVDRVPGQGGPSGEEEPAQDGSDQADSGGASSGPDSGPLGAARPVVVVVVRTADGALDGLGDPLGTLGDPLVPVREAASTLPTDLLAPPQGDVQEPAPASATAAEAKPDLPMPLLVAGTAAAAAAAVAVLWLAGSSGSLGAAGAGAAGAGKLAGTDLRRLLPFASPLFTRFEKDTVLGHPKREALYALVLQDPGVSLQALCDATGLSRTAVTHHLRLMELQHLIVSKRMGRSRHYYENGGRFGRDQKDAYAVLQNDRSRQVAQFVKQNPGAIQKAVCAAVGVQASVAHWHLRRLQEAQLVEAVRHGRTVSYFPGAGLKGIALHAAAPAPAAMPAAAPLPLST